MRKTCSNCGSRSPAARNRVGTKLMSEDTSVPSVENEDKYIQVLEWEEDVLEDRLKNVRMEDRHELAQAYHRRLEKVRTELRQRS